MRVRTFATISPLNEKLGDRWNTISVRRDKLGRFEEFPIGINFRDLNLWIVQNVGLHIVIFVLQLSLSM